MLNKNIYAYIYIYIKQFFLISFNICQKLETQQGKN